VCTTWSHPFVYSSNAWRNVSSPSQMRKAEMSPIARLPSFPEKDIVWNMRNNC
jgi:hypothetical protein